MATTSITNVSPAPAMTWHTFQDEGGRPQQEDRIVVHQFITRDGMPATLFILADGIGGHGSGELASQRAVELIPAYIDGHEFTASEMSAVLKAAFEHANAQIYKEAEENEQYAGMGTTCTAVVIIGKRLYIAHVGDSRAYLLRGNHLQQLSIDHTWAEEALAAGRPPEEIRNHPNRSVIKRFLGIDPEMEIDTRYKLSDVRGDVEDSAVKPLFLEPGDTIMLCSDGVSDPLTPKEIIKLLQRPAEKAPEALVQRALKAGSTDNVSAIVVRLAGGEAARRSVPAWVWGMGGALLILLVAVAVVWAMKASPSTAPESVAAGQPTWTATATHSSPNTPLPGGATVPIAENDQNGNFLVIKTPTLPPSTATPTPISTPTPLAATNTPTPRPTAPHPSPPPTSSTSKYNFVVNLLEPPKGFAGDEVTLKWQSAPLPEGLAFEPIVWKKGRSTDMKAHGMSPTGVTLENSATTRMSNLEGVEPLKMQSGKDYFWGVCIAQNEPYQRLWCTNGRKFHYERSNRQAPPPAPQNKED